MSLQQYLNRRYFVITGFLVALCTFLISFMNLSGMDDTTAYYMLYEGELISEKYQAGEAIAEFDPGVKEYYWQREGLPTIYQNLDKDDPFVDNYVKPYVFENEFVYILPYVSQTLSEKLYVVHIFPNDDYELANRNLRLQYSALALLSFLLAIGLIFNANRNVIRQLLKFEDWISDVIRMDPKQLKQSQVPEQVRFSELVTGASTIHESLLKEVELREKEQEMIQREKEFLASLSHELRTPISVIAAAIGLMTKRDKLDEKDRQTLKKLAKANDNMKLLTNSILQVWRKQEGPAVHRDITLSQVVEEAVQDCKSYCRESLQFEVTSNSEETVCIDPTLVQIVANNLIRNASQHADEDWIQIHIERDSIEIHNAYELEQSQEAKSQLSGFGFGLYIVETICEQQGWQITITAEPPEFRVKVVLKDAILASIEHELGRES